MSSPKLLPIFSFGVVATTALILLAGCNSPADDPRIAELRVKYLLTEKPDGAISVAVLKQNLEGPAADNLIGDALPVPPAFESLDTGTLEIEPANSEEKTDETPEEPKTTEEKIETEDAAGSNGDQAENAHLEGNVTLVGQIGSKKGSLVDGHAAFFITDPIPEDHAHGPGGAESCPFCSERLKNAPYAAIQFVDDQKAILPIDSRQLFGVDHNKIVVIRGKATQDSEGVITVNASGIYVED